MEQNELDLTTNEVENNGEIDTVLGDNAKTAPFWQRVRTRLPVIAVWARYLFPLLAVLSLFVMSFFYNVKIYSGGVEQELSILRLYLNTFKGMHSYLGGATMAGRSWFYGIVTAGAIVGILSFLVALFLAGLAAYTAVRAFLLGHESEESDRMKLIFKIAFPNRVWLFLSELLILVPLLYPNFFSLVSTNFLAISGGSVIFVLLNRPLIVGVVVLALTLVLALILPRHERHEKMNMFLLHRMQETERDGQEDED